MAKLELEEDIRLLPQKMELGRLELLTQSVKLPFEQIQQQLQAYARRPSSHLRDELRREIKRYLGRLNANPLFPLSFRLKVLESFESYTELFDVELIAQVLNAYKIGIQLLQKSAMKRSEYWPILIRWTAKTLELAEVLLFDVLQSHRVQHVIAMRQTMDLMKLGMMAAQNEAVEAPADIERLYRAVVRHELLRCMDLYSHTHEEQQLIRGELGRFCNRIEPAYVAKGDPLPRDMDIYLITAIHEPHHRPYKLARLPAKAERELILMPLGDFLEAIKHDIKLAKAAAELSEEERAEVMSKERFREIMGGAVFIPKALQTLQRKHPREVVQGVRVLIDMDIQSAFASFTAKGLCLGGDMLNPAERREAWSVRDTSESGMHIESIHEAPLELVVGQLVGIRWVEQRLGVNVGFVKWYREEKPGNQHMGIKFLGKGLRPVRGVVVLSDVVQFPTSMHFLQHPDFPKELLVPKPGLQIGDRLRFQLEGDEVACHVTLLLREGVNYTYCGVSLDGVGTAGTSLSI